MLREAADERVAAQARKYFKSYENVAFLGINTPRIREIEGEIYRAVKDSWTVDDAVRFCDALIRNRFLEAKGVGILLLSRFKKEFARSLFESARLWLAGGYCGNWATTDVLSGDIIAPLLAEYPDLLAELLTWTGSENLWVRRASAVSLVPLVRKGARLDEAYAVAELLFEHPEDLIHKAIGWLLRECGKTDAPRLEVFLVGHGSRIPRTALRYAIERFPEPHRKRILEQTRSPS
jgi:3-methyladenine DNA glycosylase AlkD